MQLLLLLDASGVDSRTLRDNCDNKTPKQQELKKIGFTPPGPPMGPLASSLARSATDLEFAQEVRAMPLSPILLMLCV